MTMRKFNIDIEMLRKPLVIDISQGIVMWQEKMVMLENRRIYSGKFWLPIVVDIEAATETALRSLSIDSCE